MVPIIHEARNACGKSWAAIAEAVGMTENTIRSYQQGRRLVPAHRWQSLARALDVAPEAFDRERYLREFAQINREAPKRPAQAQPDICAPTPTKAATQAPQAPENTAGGWFAGLFLGD